MKDQLPGALAALLDALDAPRGTGPDLGNWRWTARQRLASVRETLALEHAHAADGWLAAREGSVMRERNALLNRLVAMGPMVLQAPDVEQVRSDLKRLSSDISRYHQRLTDLAYDEVELELGGSE